MPPTQFQRAVEHFARPPRPPRQDPVPVPWWDRRVPVKGWALACLLANAAVGFADLVSRALA